MAVKNTDDLRAILVETIQGVKSKTIDFRQAQAISALSGRILESARLDMQAAQVGVPRVAKSVKLLGSRG